MTKTLAKAYPRKRFFIDMFTRDIDIYGSVLDLIDNSLDALIRTRRIDLDQSLLPEELPSASAPARDLPAVKIQFSDRQFSIDDNCGGIPLQEAKEVVFNFGRPESQGPGQAGGLLSVYGIGLKRAIFKLGRHFTIASSTTEGGFRSRVDLDKWVKKDEAFEDWTFPLWTASRAKSAYSAGTRIVVRELRTEVRELFRETGFQVRLERDIARAYALFLDRYVQIAANGHRIVPIPVPLAASDEVTPAYKHLEVDGVSVTLVASLARRDWKAEQAGWYVACNGRMVVAADKTELTGWGGGALPQFVPKYRGFVGVALFRSNDPILLPWRTTKQGLNQESAVYQRVRNQMRAVARPILTFLDNMYTVREAEEPPERQIAEGVRAVDLKELTRGQQTVFLTTPQKRKPRTTVRVQYNAERSEIASIRKHLHRPDMSASKIGEHTFKAYLQLEGLV